MDIHENSQESEFDCHRWHHYSSYKWNISKMKGESPSGTMAWIFGGMERNRPTRLSLKRSNSWGNNKVTCKSEKEIIHVMVSVKAYIC